MGVFSRNNPSDVPVEDEKVFNSEEEAVAAHDEQEVEEVNDAPSEPVEKEVPVPGSVVAPEDTVRPLDEVPADDYPSDGALPHDSNDAPQLINESNDEANNPTVNGKVKRDTSVDRKKGETQAEYNERIPVALQPVQPSPKTSYLGGKL